MPGWFSIAAPYLADIISVARPLFTRSKDNEKIPEEKIREIAAQQIAELQSAAAQNAESVKLLAIEMQKTIDALQLGAAALERKLWIVQTLAVVATTTAALAFVIAMYALVH
jgi:hypothetical protein